MEKKHLRKHSKSVSQHKKTSFKQLKLINQQKRKLLKLKSKSKKPKARIKKPKVRIKGPKVRIKRPKVRMVKFIERRRNKHKGGEIWVLGCGPSLDDFPDNFFDSKNRIAIACKWSMIAFPNCTYSAFSLSDQALTNYVLANRRHLLRSHIVHLRPTGKGAMPFSQKPIYMRVSTKLRGEGYYRTLPKYLLRGIPIRYSATGTLIHWDIQAAIIMGAKKVTLVGCEARARKFQRHALKRGMDWVYGPKGQAVGGGLRREESPPPGGYPQVWQKGKGKEYQRLSNGIFWLAKYFAPHGVQIARYYYGKDYEKIV